MPHGSHGSLLAGCARHRSVMHRWWADEIKKVTRRCDGPNVVKKDAYHDSPLQKTSAHDREPWARYSHGTSAVPTRSYLTSGRTIDNRCSRGSWRDGYGKESSWPFPLYLRSWGAYNPGRRSCPKQYIYGLLDLFEPGQSRQTSSLRDRFGC